MTFPNDERELGRREVCRVPDPLEQELEELGPDAPPASWRIHSEVTDVAAIALEKCAVAESERSVRRLRIDRDDQVRPPLTGPPVTRPLRSPGQPLPRNAFLFLEHAFVQALCRGQDWVVRVEDVAADDFGHT